MKKLLAIFLTVCVLFSFTACSTSESNSSDQQSQETVDNEQQSEQVETTVEPGAKGTLEIWTMFTGADGAAFPDIVAAYNATNPDYTVNHRAMVADELYLKLQMSVSSGEGVPDMAVNHIEQMPLFAEEGRIIDLAPYLAASGIEKSSYNATAWDMTEFDGGHYGVPLDVHSYITWVNMDLYNQYELTDLDDGVLTWEEFEKTAEIVKADGIIPIGLSWPRPIFLGSYAQMGGTLSEDGVNPSFNNDISTQVMEHYSGLVEKGYTQVDGDDSWKAFLGGDVLYMPEGVWMYNAVKEADINIAAYNFPVFDINEKGNWTSSHQFTIPTPEELDEERIKASLDFIKFVEGVAGEWAVAGLVPAATEALSDPTFAEMPQYFLASQSDELKIYDYKYYGSAVSALDKVLGDMMFNKISIEDGLSQAQQEVQDFIDIG